MENRFDNLTSNLRPDVLREIIKLSWQDPRTKINDETVCLVGEVVQIYIAEAIARSTHQAVLERETEIQAKHVEKVLPKLLLDF